MVKKLLPSMKSLKKMLMESSFDPRATGPMKVIIDSNNPDYFEMRAIELINEARILIENSLEITNPEIAATARIAYHDKVQKAISLLAMARLVRSNQ